VVAATLIGGLGNQMFQYAAARSLALRHGTDVVLDLSQLESRPPDVPTVRRYELACFGVQARLAPRIRSKEPSLPGLAMRGRLVWRARRAFAPFTVLRQKSFDVSTAFFSAPDGTHLVGFWQSERYFRDHAEEIRRDFDLREPLDARAEELLGEIRTRRSLSLHVRRGDYAHDEQVRAFHGLLPPEWFARAVRDVVERVGDVHIYVFSDDPDWCRTGLRLPAPSTVVADVGGSCAELHLMSACRHHVVANSSFSWWGAWLDPRPDKVVVAPEPWVASPGVDTRHVVPDEWIRLAWR
jgi:hypothetical protein